MKSLLLIALLLMAGCVTVKVQTGQENSTEREQKGVETTTHQRDSL